MESCVLCPFQPSVYFYFGYSYNWIITGGTSDPNPASGQGTSNINVNWGTSGAGNVRVIAEFGTCTDAASVDLGEFRKRLDE